MIAPLLRDAVAADTPFLLQMLFYAAHAHEEPGRRPEQLLEDPKLAAYVAGFGTKAGDLGVMTVGPAGPIGAAWLRTLTQDAPGYGWVADDIPELVIAVALDAVGGGIGSAMLRALLARARGRYPGVSLSVRVENPARKLYLRYGFTTVTQLTNRVGGVSETMVLRFP